MRYARSRPPASPRRARSGVRPGPLLAFALLAFTRAATAQLDAYTDALQNGFSDWSWATRNLAQTSVVHSGSAAISFEPDDWKGLFFHRAAGFTSAEFEAVELWVHGGGPGGQQVTVAILNGGTPAGSAPLAGFVAGGAIPAGSWAKATIPFSALGLTAGSWDGIWLQGAVDGDQPTLYVDDVRLLPSTSPPVGESVTVSVDTALDRRAVSPHIFGVNFGSAAQASSLRWPARRWGGNSTTRYNWQNGTSNRGMDWFFMNIPEDAVDPAQLPDGSSADRFLDETRASGGEPILTVPLIGWSPKSRAKSWGFSVAKYGTQTNTECLETGGVFWCEPDAGNGILPGGAFVTGNDPLDTSVAIGPSFVTAWMDHLAARYGTAAQGGIRWYALDNEPALWDSTHRDVHPQPLTYDELWEKTRDYAAAIKAKDPAAVVFGPVSWGWCEYFFSAADGCSPQGADHVAHGSVPLTQWYLRKVREHLDAHGVRLVDVLDVHYYPQANGVALSDDESAAASARRLRSLRSLWDPTYVDESWIGTAVRLIPRMKEWIAAELPGTKLAITEYSWGNDDGLSSALAQVEVLGIFARDGVDVATRWVAPETGTLVEDAFRLWLDYDGAGARVAGTSVRAASTTPDAVNGYAVEAPGGMLRVVLVNRDTVQRTVALAVAGGADRAVRLFGFDAGTRLAALGTAALTGGSLELDLPARSARLVEVAGVPPLVPALSPIASPIVIGGTKALSGTNFTAGSVVKLYVATATDVVSHGPFTPAAWTPTSLTWEVPATIPLGNGFGTVQVVNTDQGYTESNLEGQLLYGDAADNIPTITAVNGVALNAANPSTPLANVSTLVLPSTTVTLTGTGFGNALVNLFTGAGNVGPLTPLAGATATQLQVLVPAGTTTGPGSFQAVNSPYAGNVQSNAVSVPIGALVTVTGVVVDGNTVTVNGAGFCPLTVVNLFNLQGGSAVNLGGLNGDGSAKIPLTIVSSTQLTFQKPAGAVAGPSFVEVLNPPFIPYSSSGSDPDGAFAMP